jgi:3-deoxy-D-manno-octulosonic-acid transferase
MRKLYSLLFYIGLPLIWMRLLWRARRNPDYAKRWNERLGHVPNDIKPGGIWWHAVSVGETLAAVSLIKKLQQKYPAIPILVTTMTPSGSAQVKTRLGESVEHVYVPYDMPHAVKRFLDKIQPRLLVIMETELWPNVLHECKQRGIPAILTNARLSERSANGYGKFSALVKEMLDNVTTIAVQNHEDGERFVQLGFSRERMHITGTVKFDITISDELLEQAKLLRSQWHANRPVWIAASTHPGEEEIILEAQRIIHEKLPDTLLLLVPRHPDRAKEIISLCENKNFTVCTRSSKTLPNNTTTIFLVDTLGELVLFYACADVAFVAGSLIDKGGHNVLEPAALALPVITGQSMYNFAEIERLLLKASALIKIHDATELAQQVINLLQNPAQRATLGKAAQAVVMDNRGATDKQLALIESLL